MHVPQTKWLTGSWRHLILELLIALSLAFLVWLYIHSRAQTTLDHIQVPVQVQLVPSQRDLFDMEVVGDARITASFSGPSSRLRELKKKLQRGQVKVTLTVTVPDDKVNEPACTEVVHVDPAQVPAPPGIHVELADDARAIRLNLTRMAERILPIRLEHTGEVKVSQVKIEPSTVLVRGPQAVVEKVAAIGTQPYALEAPSDEKADPTVRGKASLATEIDGQHIFTSLKQVTFRCNVHAKHKVYEVTDIPVLFLCPPEFPYRPRFAQDKAGKISIRLAGPASEERPPVLAFVELTGTNLTRGRNLEPVRLQLPKDFTLLSNSTPVIAFFLDEAERAPAARAEPLPKD